MFLKRVWWTGYLAWQLRGQARYPFKPLAAIRRDQARRVRRMVAYACRHVPYYRETMKRLGLTPADFRSADDLAKLPITEREALQRDPERFVSDAVRLDRCMRHPTSGSSGRPVTVYFDRPALFLVGAHGERHRAVVRARVGRRYGYRETAILTMDRGLTPFGRFWRANSLLLRSLPVRLQRLSLLDPPEVNVPLMDEFRPGVLATHGSYVERLFPYLRAAREPHHLPKVVVYSSDNLSASVRRLIGEEFGIPIVSEYRAIEAPRLAFECEQHRGLHVNLDIYPVRIVDAAGRDVAPGALGNVVVSNLVNRATVLLNYRLGDLAALLPEPCPCGRSLPLLSFPMGRSDDFITLPSGQTRQPCVLKYHLTEEPRIWQYQIVQESLCRLRVALVVAEGCDRAALRERLAPRLAKALGDEVTVDIAFVDRIEPTPAGKHKPVVSALPAAQREPPAGMPPAQPMEA